MAKTFFTSDLHLGHDNILKFTDRNYRNIQEMDLSVIHTINRYVHPEDTLYILGDVVWNTSNPWILNSIKCRNVHIIFGNHDRNRYAYSKIPNIKGVFEEVVLRIAGEDMRLSHYPYRYKGFSLFMAKVKQFLGISPRAKYLEKRPYNDGKYLLHGHTHSKAKVKGKQIHVGWDAWGKPVSLRDIESIMQRTKNGETIL